MVRFTYTAEKTDGEMYKGSADARDRFELYQTIRKEGGRVVAVNEEGKDNAFTLSYWNRKLGNVSQYERILFARNLGAMLAAGLPLSRALAVMERQTRNAKLMEVVSSISDDVRRGLSLHDALAKFPKTFSKLFIAMVRAGEEGGELPQALSVIADQMERMYTLKKKVRGALIYPAIIVVTIVGIGVLMMTQVVPTLAQTFEEMNAELPQSTQIVIGISNFLVQYSVFALLLVIAAGALFFSAIRTVAGKRLVDTLVLKLPLIGTIAREVNSARTARTLSSLLSSGVDIMSSLDIVADVVQNTYFKDVLHQARDAVGRGEPLSVTFARNEHLYPAFVGEMTAVGEETGQTNDMYKRLSQYYEDEVDRKTKDMSTIIEPFLMVIIGAAVGFFAVSMISPIYSLSSNI
jgi:type IV pilus assembly protein PilC